MYGMFSIQQTTDLRNSNHERCEHYGERCRHPEPSDIIVEGQVLPEDEAPKEPPRLRCMHPWFLRVASALPAASTSAYSGKINQSVTNHYKYRAFDRTSAALE